MRISSRQTPWVRVYHLAQAVLLLILLAACSARQPLPGLQKSPSAAPVTATQLVTQTAQPTPTARPSTPAPSAVPTATRLSPTRPPSGWKIYSNSDYVQGIALHERQLWAATLGGVVMWNLDSRQPTLYTTRDGLADIQGNDVVFCSMPEDRIIVAHPSAFLSAYDLSLNKWSRIPVTFDDGSTIHGVQNLLCDSPNRRLIVGSSEGLAILDMKTGRWQRIGPAEGLKVKRINSIQVIGQTIWVAAGDQGAFMIMGRTIFPWNASSGFPSGRVYDLSVAPDRSIWFGYSTGLVHYQDKKWNAYGAKTVYGIPFNSVDQVEVGADKKIWIAGANEGICPFDPVSLDCATVYSGVPDAPITDLVVGADGVAYASTNGGGVLMLEADGVTRLVQNRQQLISNDVLDVAEGSDGRLWVATDRGVNQINPGQPDSTWQSLVPSSGQLAFPRISGMLPVNGGMWFLYDREPQVTFTDGEKWLQLDSTKGITDPILSAAVDQRGYAWFASAKGIQVWDGTLMRAYAPPDGWPGTIRTLFAQGDKMWVGTDRGLLLYQRFTWQTVLPGVSVNAVAGDLGGGLLLGTDEGVIRYDGSQSFLWIINLGDEVFINPKITSLLWDRNHQLWVGTAEEGLFNFDGSRWERFSTATGLPVNHIRKIYTDRLGGVWIAAVTGEGGGALVRFTP